MGMSVGGARGAGGAGKQEGRPSLGISFKIGMVVIKASVIDPMYGAAVRCNCSPRGQSTRANSTPRESVSWQRPPPFHLVGGDELGAVEMLIRRRRGWELRKSEATPEEVFLGRRRLLRGVAGGWIVASGLGAVIFGGDYGNRDVAPQMAALPAEDDPSAGLYPAKRNPRFTLDRPLPDEKFATTYTNFYEFGSQKSIAAEARALKIRPWTIKIDGLVDKPLTVDIDDLLKKMPLEERLCRHRCVEAWSMAVPWSGFPMSAFVDFAKPLRSAKYVRMETFLHRTTAPWQRGFWYPWPYVEGLTIADSGNELAFLVTRMYGNPVPKHDRPPFRLPPPRHSPSQPPNPISHSSSTHA